MRWSGQASLIRFLLPDVRIALVQLTSSDDPDANLPQTLALIRQAADAGAQFVLTPEVTNCVSASRERQAQVLCPEDKDSTLALLRAEARRAGIWLLIGSLALKQEEPAARFVNRSFLVTPTGEIAARYDKLHMFDVTISEEETYRESAGYQPGDAAVLTQVDSTLVGMTVCYDVRFAYLYRQLAQAGAQILTIPAAFAPDTGVAHWEVLLRARAIETGSFVLAPAQCGTHAAKVGRQRRTYGHSLAIDPWGRVLADGGDSPGVTVVDLDLSAVEDARRRLPSLTHDRTYKAPHA
jgi:predicted amidohydrolase